MISKSDEDEMDNAVASQDKSMLSTVEVKQQQPLID